MRWRDAEYESGCRGHMPYKQTPIGPATALQLYRGRGRPSGLGPLTNDTRKKNERTDLKC